LDTLTLEDGTATLSNDSGKKKNYQSMLCNNPKKQRPSLQLNFNHTDW